MTRRLELEGLARARVRAQGLDGSRRRSPEVVVAALGAVQAQDYHACLWAIGRRMGKASVAEVEAAFDQGSVVRTWPMRGTLHAVAAADVRGLLALGAPRALARAAGRHRQLGLDQAAFDQARTALERELAGGGSVTREECWRVLAGAGVSPAGQRGIHVVGYLAHVGYLCSGPRRGKQPTYARLDDRVPATPLPSRLEGLRVLARRYVFGHGPASDRDLAWWAGLTLTEARAALAAVDLRRVLGPAGELWSAARPPSTRPVGAALLPAFDELLVGFAGREALLAPEHAPLVVNGGILAPTLVVDGRAVGTWRRSLGRTRVTLELTPFDRRPAPAVRDALEAEAGRYGAFLGLEPQVRWLSPRPGVRARRG